MDTGVSRDSRDSRAICTCLLGKDCRPGLCTPCLGWLLISWKPLLTLLTQLSPVLMRVPVSRDAIRLIEHLRTAISLVCLIVIEPNLGGLGECRTQIGKGCKYVYSLLNVPMTSANLANAARPSPFHELSRHC